MESSDHFRRRLIRDVGLSADTVALAWPDWWSNEADASLSAQTELRFSIARKLGLDPRSLIDDEQAPRFLWQDEAKFKNLRGQDALSIAALGAFGKALAATLIAATPELAPFEPRTADALRALLLRNAQFVDLSSLLSACWGLSIPVIHLRVYPLSAKKMCAMSIRVGDRYAIFLAQDAKYPAVSAFHLAHEIGHIMEGHLQQQSLLIDMEDTLSELEEHDDDETSADRFASTLLTGNPDFEVMRVGEGRNARQLAQIALREAPRLGIEPGAFVLAYGHSMNDWPVAYSALTHVYVDEKPVWNEVNRLALRQLDLENVPDEAAQFMKAVMGGASIDVGRR